jgi:hypothetical protein
MSVLQGHCGIPQNLALDRACHALGQSRSDEAVILTLAIGVMKGGGDGDVVLQQEAPKMQVVNVRKLIEEIGEDLRIVSSHLPATTLSVDSENLRRLLGDGMVQGSRWWSTRRGPP